MNVHSEVYGLLGKIIEKFNYSDRSYHLIINNQIHLFNTHDNNLDIHSGDLTFGIDATLGSISLGNIYSLLLLDGGRAVCGWTACLEGDEQNERFIESKINSDNPADDGDLLSGSHRAG